MAKYIKVKALTRSDTSANWSKNNPVLGKGECGYATDLRRTKHGDGTAKWNSLKWDDAATVNGHSVNSDVPAGAKFTDTTYAAATTSANGLMSAADKKAVDREFFRMLPKGGTHIPANADLNSLEYIRVGNYYNSLDVESKTIKNIPLASAFMMYVLSPLSEVYDNEKTSQWVYRLRILVNYRGENVFIQFVSSGATKGEFTYNAWLKLTNSKDLAAVSNIINAHIGNKANPHAVTKAQVGLGSVANIDQSKAIKSITRSGTTFTATALDGTKTTFTQQDSNTTYGIATSSADGLMSKSDKAKLDGISSGADAVTIKTVKVNGTALTPDSNKAVNVTVPTLANNATTTASGMALDARMGKTLSDQISSVKTGAIDQIVNLTAAGWTGDAAPYSQAVTVTDMTSELLCELFSACSKSATVAERKAYNKAYAIVASGYAETADGKVTFSVDKKPAIDIGVRIKSISKANGVSDQTSSDITSAVDAMSNNLSGKMNTQETSITDLQNKVTSLTADLAKKAEASDLANKASTSDLTALQNTLASHSALHVLPLSDIVDAQNGFDIQFCNVAIQGKIVLCWLSFGMNSISIPQWNDFAFAKLKSGYYPAKTRPNGPTGIIQEQTSGLTGEITIKDNTIMINTHAVSFNSQGWAWGFIAFVLA